jgi:hypothetical protein
MNRPEPHACGSPNACPMTQGSLAQRLRPRRA